MIKRREFLKFSGYLLGFLGIPALSFGGNKEQKKISNRKNISGNNLSHLNNKVIKRYDERGNLIYQKFLNGGEYWKEYDKNNNLKYVKWGGDLDWEEWYEYSKNRKVVYHKGRMNKINYVSERWQEYDKNDNRIHYKHSDGDERWYEYYKGHKIEITEKEFEYIQYNIKIREYDSRTKCSRFELMEI